MRAAVLVFPGSNCDRDLAVALRAAGAQVEMVWHKETALPDRTDLVAVPGGFSYGDYLRCGAIAAQSPVCRAVADHAARGGHVLGICNGFQVLTEMRLLPGVLMRNAGLTFLCRPETLMVRSTGSDFTAGYSEGQEVVFPIAHHDGNYTATEEELDRLEGEGRVAFTYANNPNGSARDIAGILSENRRVLGLMPHPERAVDPVHGGTDGVALFRSLVGALAIA
ncbi:MAG: phosphoribosylformylglycinamidine synthase subunit PurQ [Rhodosalinus sp.]|uniref:phosphoribosylformylglycinamidine synthase subunit PurQ n=1 Tax=Rhodosalinus sp. TaxID=2047741 RepID=UPI0039790DC3